LMISAQKAALAHGGDDSDVNIVLVRAVFWGCMSGGTCCPLFLRVHVGGTRGGNFQYQNIKGQRLGSLKSLWYMLVVLVV
jgi:hypothetical protein